MKIIELPTPIRFGDCSISHMQICEYDNGGAIAVELLCDDGESWATLSVNMPEDAYMLDEGEFFLKDWSENEDTARAMLKMGYIVPVDKPFIRSGFVNVKTVAIADELLAIAHDDEEDDGPAEEDRMAQSKADALDTDYEDDGDGEIGADGKYRSADD